MTMAYMSHQLPRTSHFGPPVTPHRCDPGRTTPRLASVGWPQRVRTTPADRATTPPTSRPPTPRARQGRVTTVTGTAQVPPHPEGVFGRASGHEQVVFCHDEPTGLQAIIAIYSTALGPALGGTRFYPYATEQDALDDVLNLSRGHGLQGRAGRPRPRRRQGRHHRRPRHSSRPRRCCAPTAASCSRSAAATTPPATSARTARTWTTSPASAPTSPAAPSSTAAPATPPCSRRTASSRACAPRPSAPGARPRCTAARSASPASARSAGTWSRHLVEDGADGRRHRRRPRPRSTRCAAEHPEVTRGRRHRRAGRLRARRLRPVRARRRAHRRGRRRRSRAKIVCGAANNQLAHHGIEKLLAGPRHPLRARLLVNAGGLIQVADELEGFSLRARQAARREDLRHHRAGVRRWPTPTASRRRWPPTGSPSAGCPRSAGCAASGSAEPLRRLAVTAKASPPATGRGTRRLDGAGRSEPGR